MRRIARSDCAPRAFAFPEHLDNAYPDDARHDHRSAAHEPDTQFVIE